MFAKKADSAESSGKDGKNWYADRYQSAMVQRNLLAVICLLAVAFSFVAIFLVYLQVPIVTVAPFVIQVDEKSGITQIVSRNTKRTITAKQAVSEYFIVQYITARESFGIGDYRGAYKKVHTMSRPGDVLNGYRAMQRRSDPESVYARFSTGGTRTVQVKTLVFLEPRKAQIRMVIKERTGNGQVTNLHRTVYIEFDYVELEISQSEKYVNPLGFLVTAYHVSEDVLSP